MHNSAARSEAAATALKSELVLPSLPLYRRSSSFPVVPWRRARLNDSSLFARLLLFSASEPTGQRGKVQRKGTNEPGRQKDGEAGNRILEVPLKIKRTPRCSQDPCTTPCSFDGRRRRDKERLKLDEKRGKRREEGKERKGTE